MCTDSYKSGNLEKFECELKSSYSKHGLLTCCSTKEGSNGQLVCLPVSSRGLADLSRGRYDQQQRACWLVTGQVGSAAKGLLTCHRAGRVSSRGLADLSQGRYSQQQRACWHVTGQVWSAAEGLLTCHRAITVSSRGFVDLYRAEEGNNRQFASGQAGPATNGVLVCHKTEVICSRRFTYLLLYRWGQQLKFTYLTRWHVTMQASNRITGLFSIFQPLVGSGQQHGDYLSCLWAEEANSSGLTDLPQTRWCQQQRLIYLPKSMWGQRQKVHLPTCRQKRSAAESWLACLRADGVSTEVYLPAACGVSSRGLLTCHRWCQQQRFTYLPQVVSAVEVYLHSTGQVRSATESLLTSSRAGGVSEGSDGRQYYEQGENHHGAWL